MKFFFRFVAPVLAILWLAKIRPLTAALAILLCGIRCAFKSHLFGRLFAHFIYDLMKAATLGLARLLFHQRRS